MSKVAVIRTTSENAIANIREIMTLAGAAKALDSNSTTILKYNLY